jgi:hypothetical protein
MNREALEQIFPEELKGFRAPPVAEPPPMRNAGGIIKIYPIQISPTTPAAKDFQDAG